MSIPEDATLSGATVIRVDAQDTESGISDAKREALVLPMPVIPELDYLIGKRLDRVARLAFLEDVIAGVYAVEEVPTELFENIRSRCGNQIWIWGS